MSFALYVFDLDGTLVDSRRDLADAANAVLVECGARPLGEAAIGRMVGEGAAVLVARAFASAGVPQPDDALARFLRAYDTRLVMHTRPYDGIPDALAALSTRGSLAVLTNKPKGATDRILAALGLARYFDRAAVIGGDGPFARKPDPGALRHLAERAGAPLSRTILIGDSAIDWRTARSAGTSVCLARYGFGFDGFPVGELIGDERFVDAPAELVQL